MKTTYITAIYTSFDGKNQLEEYAPGFLQNTLLHYIHHEEQVIDSISVKNANTYPEKVDCVLENVNVKIVKIPEIIYDEMTECSKNPHIIEWRNGDKYMEALYNKSENISSQYDFYNPSI